MNCISNGKYTGDSCFGCKIKIEDCEIRDKIYKNRWIPTKERFPDEELTDCILKKDSSAVFPVLITIRRKNMSGEFYLCVEKAYYSEFLGKESRTFSDKNMHRLNPIAWQPLPTPYCEEL